MHYTVQFNSAIPKYLQ